MTTLTAKQRGDMAEELLPTAAYLVTLVHGDGGPRDVHQLVARLSPAHKEALLIVLAGLVDPDQPMGQALRWLDFDESGALTVPPRDEATRVRDMAADPELGDPDEYVDEVAVAHYVKGKPVQLTKPERLAAVALAIKQGLSCLDLDAMHNLRKGDTSTFVSRMRKKHAEQGLPFPVVSPATSARRFTEAEIVAIRVRSAQGATDLEVGLSFGTKPETVAHICRGERYAEFGGPIRAKRSGASVEASREYMCGHAADSKDARPASVRRQEQVSLTGRDINQNEMESAA